MRFHRCSRGAGLFPILLIAALSPALEAQTGFVKSAGQPLPGATVTASQGDVKVTTTTDPGGHYKLPPLAKGIWTIEVSMFGFEPARKQVNDPEPLRQLDFSLTLRESQFAARLRDLGRARAQGSSPIDAQMQQAETSANQPQPEVSADGANSNESFLLSGSLSQGLSANAPPDSGPSQPGGPDPSGHYGRHDNAMAGPPPNAPGFSGGSGRRDFGGHFGGPHGSSHHSHDPGSSRSAHFGNHHAPNQIRGMVFATLDNSALDARPFSITGQDMQQPAYARGRFGVLAGGPLMIPKLVNDQSTFFFLSYFATRARNPYTTFATVPDALERQGDFSQAAQSGNPVSLYDPLTHQPFPGNAIPSNRIDPIARNLLGYVPLPNQPGSVNNYEYQTSVPQDTDNFGARVMRNLSKTDRLSFHFGYQRRDGDTAQPFGFLDSSSGTGVNTDATWTRTLSPTLVNNLRVSFNRNRNEGLPFFAYGPDVAAQFGITGTSNDPINFGPPNLNFTNYAGLTDGTAALRRNQNQSLGDGVILTRGKHSFTFGAQFARNDLNTRTDPNGRGTFNFTGLATSAFTSSGAPLPGTGFDLADFLLGMPQSSSIRYGDSSTYFRQNVWSGYAQDEWKIRADLSLNAGLRYEYFSPLTEKYDRMANLDIAPGFTGVAVVTPGAAGPYSGAFPAGLINPDYTNIGPRIGLAWKVPKIHRSTVVRLGYGIYYNGQIYNGFGLKLAQQPPFAVSDSVNTSAANVLTLAQGFVATTPGEITNTYAIDRNYRTPYAQTWTLAIQHDLPAGFFVELGYLGTKGTHLDVLTLPNEGPAAGLQNRTQLGNAVGFTFDSSVGNSIYNALQLRVQRRFRHGLALNAFYTFSKSIDDSSTFGGAGNTVAQNWLDLAAERGLSSFDRRQTLTGGWVWTSPVAANGSPAETMGARLLKDWQLSGSLTAETGTPFTARALGNSARLAQTGAVGSGRAEATGEPVDSGTGFFNPAAFTSPPPGQFGDVGRNTIPGPGMVVLNLSFGRSFALFDSRRRLELRVEASNAFNQVNYTNINTVVNAINYGLPVSAASMRSVTAVLRFRF